jgi:NitT/TauT family transport system substrate-binding protein
MKRFALLLALAAGLSAPAAVGRAQEGVSIRLNHLPWGMHIAYFAALEKGYFKEQGLDVKIIPGHGALEAVNTVGAGKEDIGLATVDTVLVAQAKGVPIKVFAMDMYENPSCLIFMKSSGIARPKDLEGKRLGHLPASSMRYLTDAAMKLGGVDLGKITYVNHPAGAEFQLLTAGKLDAFGGFCMGQAPTLEAKGFKVGMLSMKDLGADVYGTMLFAHERTIKERPDMLVKFLRAWLKGQAYAYQNVNESTKLLLKHRPDRDMLEAAKFKMVLAADRSEEARQRGFGVMTDEGWQRSIDILIKARMLEKALKPKDVYTNDLIEKAPEGKEFARLLFTAQPKD